MLYSVASARAAPVGPWHRAAAPHRRRETGPSRERTPTSPPEPPRRGEARRLAPCSSVLLCPTGSSERWRAPQAWTRASSFANELIASVSLIRHRLECLLQHVF